jgi:hypothetical protein
MLQARSLLTAHEDFTTLQFHVGTEVQRPGFVFSALKQRLTEAKVEEIKRICLTVDQKSAIFDVPSQYVKVCVRTTHLVRCHALCIIVYQRSRESTAHLACYCKF